MTVTKRDDLKQYPSTFRDGYHAGFAEGSDDGFIRGYKIGHDDKIQEHEQELTSVAAQRDKANMHARALAENIRDTEMHAVAREQALIRQNNDLEQQLAKIEAGNSALREGIKKVAQEMCESTNDFVRLANILRDKRGMLYFSHLDESARAIEFEALTIKYDCGLLIVGINCLTRNECCFRADQITRWDVARAHETA